MIMHHITYLLALLLIMSMTNFLKAFFLEVLVLKEWFSVTEENKGALE